MATSTKTNANTVSGKVVVITGASSGIGEGIGRHLARLGAKVVLGARRVANLEKITSEIKTQGGEAALFSVDVTNAKNVEEFAQFAVSTYGRIDVFINNAGIASFGPMDALLVSEWERMISVNVNGTLYGVAALIPIFKKQGFGHFINIASVGALVVNPMGVVYNATKHAVRVISEGLRLELSKSANIRVTNINPGTTTTELLGNTSHEATFNYISQFLGGAQALSADTIGHAVQFVIELPDSTSVNEITIRPTAAPH